MNGSAHGNGLTSNILLPDRGDSEMSSSIDLIGGPWAIIESDSGVFTTVMHRLGVTGCEAAEVYSVDGDGLSHLGRIHAFIFCSQVQRYSNLTMHVAGPTGSEDGQECPMPWFSSQVISNACATQGILNVLLNCPDVNKGQALEKFKDFTIDMNPVMRGLALSNDPLLREVHNSMARPADLRDALATLANGAALTEAEKKKASQPKKPKVKTNGIKKKAKVSDDDDAYHYVGYVPIGGKVWELDGLRAGPLEVGDIPSSAEGGDWLDIVRPAIRLKMESLQNGTGENIRFNLLAIVEGGWEKLVDQFELVRRERRALEERLESAAPNWQRSLNDQELFPQAVQLFDQHPPHQPFALDFGSQFQDKKLRILRLKEDELQSEWVQCIQRGHTLARAMAEEDEKAQRWRTEGIKRAHDYEPFLRQMIEALSDEGLLKPMLGVDEPESEDGSEYEEPKNKRSKKRAS